MENKSGEKKLSMTYKVKETIVKTSLLALATTFEIVSKHSPELKAEIADWEDGRVFSLGVLPDGPAVSLKKEGDQIRYLGKGYKNPKLKVLFKNVDAALLPFTGQMGSHTAFVQHRAIVHGNIGEAMQASRAMDIVQTYLMPVFILKKNSKRPPKLTGAEMLLKARVMTTLGIGLLLNMTK